MSLSIMLSSPEAQRFLRGEYAGTYQPAVRRLLCIGYRVAKGHVLVLRGCN